MQPWKRIEPTTVTQVGWRKITTKTFRMPDGEVATFDLLHPDGQVFVNVILVTDDHKVMVTREFCPGPELVMDQLPGGFVDEGEDLEKAARRELLEETGYEPGSLTYLGKFHKDKYINATWHTFFAVGGHKVRDQDLEAEEFIEVVLLPIEEFINNAKNDRTANHAPVLLAYDRLKQIQQGDK